MDDERFKLLNKDSFFQNVLGRGVLEGYSLSFTRKSENGGRADIVETGGVVEGKAYLVDREALDYLLMREGAVKCIYRPAFVDIRIGNRLVKDALTFLVIDKASEEIAPPENYLTEIRRGGKTVWTVHYARRFETELRLKFGLV